MARLSKQSFAFHEDAGIPTPDSTLSDPFEDVSEDDSGPQAHRIYRAVDAQSAPQQDGTRLEAAVEEEEKHRRASAFTRTSVSSLPDSTYAEDKAYTPPVIRPSFMRLESVRRMQMTSPPPYRSPRQSVLRHNRSRTGTPQSMRSAQARGSPRPKRHTSSVTDTVLDKAEYPLVLLHITLLPVMLPWSSEAMQEILPKQASDDLQLLRSKVTETVARRGLLISHPHEEYEMLEERLLEALELKEERITKCGHFRARPSDASTVSMGSDSGLGSSVDDVSDVDGTVCETCHSPIKGSHKSSRPPRWTIKVFAANGLMRASAWSAAWSEMEAVDVEILPLIDDATRARLDERREEEVREECAREDAEAERAREQEEAQMMAAAAAGRGVYHAPVHEVYAAPPTKAEPSAADLPQIYRPSEVPLSILLKNYLLLLARDRWNVAMFFLGLVALWFAVMRSAMPSSATTISRVDVTNFTESVFETVEPVAWLTENDSVEVVSGTYMAGELDDTIPNITGLETIALNASAEDDTAPGL
ncbi:hypothetical protein LTR62_001055 [Meristemomyces frigidus]|uniref:Pathway-specific nitrogen regulator n=1 Tax=Meristemomyces frigidus TaxID=1508187 RepID=A0AAN7T9L8_9PEZI|nr:hypothetical protein LTR62_001055 [Meristemomyces frigidus]